MRSFAYQYCLWQFAVAMTDFNILKEIQWLRKPKVFNSLDFSENIWQTFLSW